MIRKVLRKLFGRRKASKAELWRASGVRITNDSALGDNTAIGHGTNIGRGLFISSGTDFPVTIGKYCAIAHNFRIRARNHSIGFPCMQHQLLKDLGIAAPVANKAGVVIGNAVWVGDNVIVLPGVNVGDGAAIGAGSIVTRDVAPYSVVAGAPAKELRKRYSPEIIAEMDRLIWWDWSFERMSRNKRFFSADVSEILSEQLVEIIEE
jgi:virginiamycin A acetyltransferase